MIKPTILFWLLWIFVTSIGSIIGFLVSPLFIPFFSGDWYLDFDILLVNMVISGFLIGFGQWIILRKRFKNVWGWTFTTAIGLPLGVCIGLFGIVVKLPASDFDMAHVTGITTCVAGLIIGVFQWLVLRAKFGSGFTWILVSVLSWGIGITLPFFIYQTYLRNGGYLEWNITGMLMGAIVGTISGAFAESMLMQTEHMRMVPNDAS